MQPSLQSFGAALGAKFVKPFPQSGFAGIRKAVRQNAQVVYLNKAHAVFEMTPQAFCQMFPARLLLVGFASTRAVKRMAGLLVLCQCIHYERHLLLFARIVLAKASERFHPCMPEVVHAHKGPRWVISGNVDGPHLSGKEASRLQALRRIRKLHTVESINEQTGGLLGGSGRTAESAAANAN